MLLNFGQNFYSIEFIFKLFSLFYFLEQFNCITMKSYLIECLPFRECGKVFHPSFLCIILYCWLYYMVIFITLFVETLTISQLRNTTFQTNTDISFAVQIIETSTYIATHIKWMIKFVTKIFSFIGANNFCHPWKFKSRNSFAICKLIPCCWSTANLSKHFNRFLFWIFNKL